MKKKTYVIAGLVLAAVLLSGCLPGDGSYTQENTAGFFWGIWHGWIAPISLIIGLFQDGVRIYEVNNSGWWYDFGFYMAIISGFGGLSLFRKERK
ncbi:MAG TPA: hypothetical protein PLT92_09355 [Ignavibacteriaceae bacterium]|jgi:hypothetical protein|nr:hypothetical protein [Ignavibacteriaceae bacterium]